MCLCGFNRPEKSKDNGFLLGTGTADNRLSIPKKPHGRKVSLMGKGSSEPWGRGVAALSQHVDWDHPKDYMSGAGAVL